MAESSEFTRCLLELPKVSVNDVRRIVPLTGALRSLQVPDPLHLALWKSSSRGQAKLPPLLVPPGVKMFSPGSAVFLCLALAVTNGLPVYAAIDLDSLPDRCEGIEFDAIAPDEKGTVFFFKGSHLWNGFHGPAHPANETFKELDNHDAGHVDAAFRMHTENPQDHDHMYLFLDDKVFSYFNHTLEDGYPKTIQEDFPEVPSHLDAAVECPKGECNEDSVLFFKGHDVYVFDIATKTVKMKTWSHLPVCTSALRWLEHHYCFNNHSFTKFHPMSGSVTNGYPKDARNYFMSCPNFGHGAGSKVPKCSEIKIDAITTDDTGKTYVFIGHKYMRLDSHRDGLHAFSITKKWKEMTNGVDAAFSYTNNIYFIKGDQVYIYKPGAQYTLVKGYPKTLKEELNIEGHVDAAFVCNNEDIVHVIQGRKLIDVNLVSTPRAVLSERPMPLSGIDGAMCGANGIHLFKGTVYYHYESVMVMAMSKIMPIPHPVTSAILGCED
ncbi:hemopexin-like [Thalassophryne amazonica]|uniref:hemopexin-like n=1 Tax=Thalassophryne amazonica TaxID=390379 RepID=UPI0014711FFB|nr:hemopexin-like [Thalassophryne amazonica]